MKTFRNFIFSGIIMLLSIQAFAQNQNSAALILKTPADWGFERYDFPIDFAPGINYKGFEEIRFSPGMMDTASAFYFSYIFAVAINDSVNLNEADIEDFLNKYYQGLSASVGKSKKLNPDTAQMKATVTNVPTPPNSSVKSYNAGISFFDTFSNGHKIFLSMEIETSYNKSNHNTYMVVIVSAADKDKTEVWNKLREIRKGAVIK
jgi:hypothetical protein